MTNEFMGTVNREYKDRLFKLIFRDKRDILELYNAINGTDYNNPEDVEINTLEDVVYMSMKNDLSFLIMNVLNLYEHQSTFSPNFPLRGLWYFASLYYKTVGNREDIYSSRLIELPFPQFIVFYNGARNEPERQILHLHDAFPLDVSNEPPALDCHAVILNINYGQNAALMDKCKKLKEYAIFVSRVRDYHKQGYLIRQSVTMTVDDCIRDGILADILRKNKEEVISMFLTEYNEQLHIENERKIASQEAMKQGEAIGEDRFAKLSAVLLEAGRLDDLKKATSDISYRQKLYQEFNL